MANASSVHMNDCLSLLVQDVPHSLVILSAILTSIVSLFTIVANSALIYGLYKTQQFSTITNKYILLMSMSDLCTGIFVLPLLVVSICLTNALRSCNFELFVQYITLLFSHFSFFMLMCISTDRYIHVTKLNRYSQFMNLRRMKIATVLSFIFSVLIAYFTVSFPTFWLQLAQCLLDLCGVSLMLFLYSLVFRKLASHTEKFKRMLGELGTSKSTIQETKKEFSATKTIRWVLGALLSLYLPYFICSVAWTYYRFDRNVNPPFSLNVMAGSSCLIALSNAAINAIIFSYGNSSVRRFIFNRVRRIRNQIMPIGGSSTTTQSYTITIGSQC